MAVTFNWFDKGKKKHAEIVTNSSPVAGTPVILLLQNTWTPDVTLSFISDLSADEADGTNYARINLSSVSQSTTSHETFVDAASPVFSSLGNSTNPLRYAVVALVGANDAASPLLFYIDFGANRSPGGQNFTVDWDASGLFKVA